MIRSTLTAAGLIFALTACAPTSDPSADPSTDTAEPGAPQDTEMAAPEATPVAPETSATEIGIETIGYPDGWELQPFWSGEYPNAFAVTQEGVTVMGHTTITFDQYPPIYCGLPHKATYSPWNSERRESDGLDFVSMVYPTTFTLAEDATIEALVGDSSEQLELTAGDQMIYKSYLAEGFFIAEKDGVQYEINEADLPQSTEFESGPEDQEWVLLTCDDAAKTRAWVRFDDAMTAPGIERYEYTGFGIASDLP